ncbi:AgmX/PglI C-terminal domain-containing protein [Polyangium aurulentum]|uniref:AgmX/PglI C-terminal domain-containing protein n=1 Tax=Polyangium aurulentum TaxID=2567896 RepID=UPI0010ADD4CE|nr:AgmX/PglI C-terminal domain-containing protein [Polyangium aurulentum]UQA56194.1 AgmX/PglI C-terminal domain-containing protein [Polyangium aurulentum]
MSLYEMFSLAGPYGWALALLGLIGLVMALVAVARIAARQHTAFSSGIAAMLTACLIAGVAIFGNWNARRLVDAAVTGAAIAPSQAERIQRFGCEEAQSISQLGLAFASLPLLLGAIAAFASTRRRKEAPLGGIYAPPEAQVESDGGARVIAAGLVLGAGAVTYLGAALPLFIPLPGRDWPHDDPRWPVLDATYEVMSSSAPDAPCQSLEDSLDRLRRLGRPPPDASEGPELLAATGRCLDERIRNIEGYRTAADRKAGLDALAKSALVLEEEQRKKVDDAAENVRPEEPEASETGSAKGDADAGAGAGTGTGSGRLASGIIQRVVRQNFVRMRACYERGLKANPKLSGKMTVRFVIALDGNVAVAESKAADIPDPEVVRCVVSVVKSLVFPQPEGGIVIVQYPIAFSPQ